MLDKNKLDNRIYSLDEIALIPKCKTEVKSRADVYTLDENGKLPLMVSPMTCILNIDNYDIFNKSTYAVFPIYANRDLKDVAGLSKGWCSFTLSDFRTITNNAIKKDPGKYFICIDTANGHMEDLYVLVPRFKYLYPNSEVMIGNIANANSYDLCCEAGIDYVRVGIGGGNGCMTSVITGVHNGLVNLLTDIRYKKLSRSAIGSDKKFLTKVIADGGIDTIDKAIKCIALGADYVMAGKMFAMCEESCGKKCYARRDVDGFGETYFDIRIDYDMSDEDYRKFCKDTNIPYNKYTRAVEYYGQSSVEGQTDRFGCVKSEPEGCKVYLPVKYTYEKLCTRFDAALRSAMSYCGCFDLESFRGYDNIKLQSISEFNLYNK
jgi:hypothetical protein